MAKDCAELEKQAREAPHNIPFGNLTRLAECWGFEKQRQKSSHHLYKQEEFPYPSTQRGRKEYGRMNFQNRNGQAKAYQVRQLLDAIDHYRSNFPGKV
jgi:hypothetical protein